MIHVPRHQVDESGAAIEPRSDWFVLAVAATARARGEGAAHEPQRKIYSHPRLREALERLFRGKCAYCETRISGADWDVDHFRPKGQVEDHPGYYWLAYEWSNLYPACAHCNQHRREKSLWGDSGPLGAGGKADRFPLCDESRRAMSPDHSIDDEEPLLLDPCRDDPEAHLTFDLQGEIHALESERGQTSIDILFLNRKRLRDSRRQVIERMVEALALMAVGPDVRSDLDAWLTRHCLGPNCEYAAAARAVHRTPALFGRGQ